MSNELTPFEKWIAGKGHDPKTISKAERIKFSDEYIAELKSNRPNATKIVHK